VVLGKSGSGKSVLIKCIVRLLDPDDGTINVLGENVSTLKRSSLSELRKKIGFLFQSGALYDSMTVKQTWISIAQNKNGSFTNSDKRKNKRGAGKCGSV